MNYLMLIPAFLISYLIGSIPFGLLLTKFFAKQDIRNIGSGNIGATNVLRTGNKKLAFLTLLLDTLKSVAAVLFFFFLLGFNSYDNDHVGLCADILTGEYIPCGSSMDYMEFSFLLVMGLFAIIGHCFPIWLKFNGGKGVATALGVLLAATPVAGLVACGVWLASAFTFKISSLAALIAIGSAPIVTALIYGPMPAVVCLLIAALIFWRHKENILRLKAGTEPKIGAKK